MSVEIEYKFKLNQSIESFIEKLKSMDYEIGPRNYEKTVMFDNKDQLMQITDGRIRLRQSGVKASISYKKPLPKVDGQPKQEIEYETEVGNFETVEKILNTMEFNESSSYEKYRTKIKIGHADLTIDEYPFATFVEIEGKEEEIKEIALNLGFNLNEHINLPADSLFNIWRKENGLSSSLHMKFSNFNE